MKIYYYYINKIHINKIKNKNHMIIAIDVEKVFVRIQYTFKIKNSKMGLEGTYLIIIKTTCHKPTAKYSIWMWETETSPQGPEQDKYISIVTSA